MCVCAIELNCCASIKLVSVRGRPNGQTGGRTVRPNDRVRASDIVVQTVKFQRYDSGSRRGDACVYVLVPDSYRAGVGTGSRIRQ